ncbi:MAG: DUF2062 domain-containing protein [Chitinivorax sp.]
MSRKLLRKYVPAREWVVRHRALRWLAPLLQHHNLWHLNRRSVAGGVAIGLFAGLVPGPLQMLCAAIMAIVGKRNLPVALFTTLYTNPLTIVPLYLLAFELGSLLLGQHGALRIPSEPAWSSLPWADWPAAGLQWLLAMGTPLFIGLPALALLLAPAGYLLVEIGWRWHVRHHWHKRQLRRKAAQD